MSEPATIFDPPDDDAEERALRDAEAEIDAGKGVPHDQVRRWLLSWGTDQELPPPPWK